MQATYNKMLRKMLLPQIQRSRLSSLFSCNFLGSGQQSNSVFLIQSSSGSQSSRCLLMRNGIRFCNAKIHVDLPSGMEIFHQPVTSNLSPTSHSGQNQRLLNQSPHRPGLEDFPHPILRYTIRRKSVSHLYNCKLQLKLAAHNFATLKQLLDATMDNPWSW